MLLKFKKYSGRCPGWSIARKVRGNITPQRFIRWYKDDKMLGIYYGMKSRFIHF